MGKEIKQNPYTVDHEVHDGLGHEVSDGLINDADVRVHQVADGLHLPLQLWVHGHGVARIHHIFTRRLKDTKIERCEGGGRQRCFVSVSAICKGPENICSPLQISTTATQRREYTSANVGHHFGSNTSEK